MMIGSGLFFCMLSCARLAGVLWVFFNELKREAEPGDGPSEADQLNSSRALARFRLNGLSPPDLGPHPRFGLL